MSLTDRELCRLLEDLLIGADMPDELRDRVWEYLDELESTGGAA